MLALKDNEVEGSKQAASDQGYKLVLKVKKGQDVTSGPIMECEYQYPERAQVDALLSNMMNELTKVFMKARDFIFDKDSSSSSFELPVPPPPSPLSRSKDHRFRVVDKKSTDFFEYIYKNMTDEYQEMYNATKKRVKGNNRDSCANQDSIRKLWAEILDNSIALLHTAAKTTILEHIKMENRTSVGDGRVDEFLAQEISKVRSQQLGLLCDQFQLCYNDLLPNKRKLLPYYSLLNV